MADGRAFDEFLKRRALYFRGFAGIIPSAAKLEILQAQLLPSLQARTNRARARSGSGMPPLPL